MDKKHINAYPVSNPERQNTMCENGDCYWEQCECEIHDHETEPKEPTDS